MFDREKIERFEQSLESNNTSPMIAKFWNEIAGDLKEWEDFINDLQNEAWESHMKLNNLRDQIKQHYKWMDFAKKTLKQLYKLPSFHFSAFDNLLAEQEYIFYLNQNLQWP